MSLILDAINRSQRERAQPGDVPGVATTHYAGATVAPGAWRQGLLGLALVIALAVIAWLLLRPLPPRGEGAADVPAAPPEAGEEAAAPATRGSAAAETAEPAEPARAPETRSKASPEPIARPIERPRQVPAEVAALYDSAPAPAADTEATTQTAPETTPATPPAAASGSEEAEPLDVEALVSRAQEEMVKNGLAEHSAPFLADLSQQRKDAIPTLLYSGHDYRGDGASTVLVNGRTAGPGQGVGKGVTVEEILPDSAVFSFEGQSFRLRALNSWVNL